MKNTGTCPKCGITDLLRIEGTVGPYGSGNNISTGTFSSVKVHRYLCCACGYSEEWVDEQDILKLQQSRQRSPYISRVGKDN